MAGELKLELLGSLNITLDGAALTGLRYAKAEALLCYLALTGRPHSREALANLLWGESLDKDARTSLRSVLSKLSRALPEHVIVGRDSVTFNRASPYFLDVETFLAKLQPQADAGALGEAVGLYRGDLMEGFYVRDAPAFEEWLAGERERLKQLVLQALHSLAVYHGEREDYAAGIGYASRLLSLEPWREDAHRQLMLMLARSGQKDAALAQYQACCRVLADELGLEASAETTELYEKIRAGEIALSRPPRHNLPLLPTALLGRHEELARIAELLAGPGCRLLTLVGTGGVGKTSLALQAARGMLEAFPDGVFFVPLAATTDPELVPAMIAQALDVREAPGHRLLESIRASLRDKKVLLLLDNFEHLLEAAPVVSELLASCPELKVIATSRAVLNLRGEFELDVPPLAVPDLSRIPGPEALLEYPSVALFYERAKAVKPEFRVTDENAAAVATICVRLDGLPLAIELAAARVKLLPPQAMLSRLERRLQLLTGGAQDLPARQRTLRGAIDWSYSLLEPGEQRLFARLSVFVGGRTLEAIEAVCNKEGGLEIDVLDGVASLLNKSLLRQEEAHDEPRLVMIETIHEYAREKLEESGEVESIRRNHAEFFLALAEKAEPHLVGGEQVAWLERLETEHGNLRAALQWADESGERKLGLCLAGALWRFWSMRFPLSEGREWLTRALKTETARTEARVKALRGAGILAELQGDYSTARSLLEESLAIYQELGDKRGIANSLNDLGIMAQEQGDHTSARQRYEQSLALARELGDKHLSAHSFNNLGAIAEDQGDYALARSLYEQGLAIAREIGNKWMISLFLITLGTTTYLQGDYSSARPPLEESLAMLKELRDKEFISYTLEAFAALIAAEGEPERAVRLYGGAEALRETIGIPLRPRYRPRYECEVEAARGKLDEERFRAAWAEGRAMSMEEAIAYVLKTGSS